MQHAAAGRLLNLDTLPALPPLFRVRRRLLNNARWGKDGKWAKMADTLESVPVLGETALAPMTGFLRGAVNLYTTFRPDA